MGPAQSFRQEPGENHSFVEIILILMRTFNTSMFFWQIAGMQKRLEDWCTDVHSMELLLEKKALDILA